MYTVTYMATLMSPMAHIRKNILGISQVDLAAICSVSQGTVSRWESGGLEPSRAELARIRREAHRRGIKWRDALFFDPPPSSPTAQFTEPQDVGLC